MRIADTVQALLQDQVRDLGFELAEVEFQKEQGNWVLTLFIDRPEGIALTDCETVSRAVEPVLDEADPIEQHYYLCVSSLGIDRPLKKDRDFERNMDRMLEVKLYAPIDKKKQFMGRLVAFDELSFTIADEKEGQRRFLKKDVALVRPHITF